jgi:hypothetical protein
MERAFHVLALVQLQDEGSRVLLDRSIISLLRREEVLKGSYSADELQPYEFTRLDCRGPLPWRRPCADHRAKGLRKDGYVSLSTNPRRRSRSESGRPSKIDGVGPRRRGSGTLGVEARSTGVATVGASAEEPHQNITVLDPRP